MLIPSWFHLNMLVHLVAVSLWLGMTVNFSMMTVPLLRELPREQAERQLSIIGRRARLLVIILVVVILISGVINLYRVGLLTQWYGWSGPYGTTMAIKLILAFLLFLGFPVLFVVVHRYGSSELEDRITRMNRLHWGISIVTVLIMFLGIMMRG